MRIVVANQNIEHRPTKQTNARGRFSPAQPHDAFKRFEPCKCVCTYRQIFVDNTANKRKSPAIATELAIALVVMGAIYNAKFAMVARQTAQNTFWQSYPD